MYQYLITETEEEHGDRYGADETTVLWGGEDETSEISKRLLAEPELKAKVPTRAVRETLVCSCGSTTCGYIRVFGLPRSVYEAEIVGLPDQTAKDARARAING